MFSKSIKTISQFFKALQSKSNCFGTLEPHVVNLIIILLYCDCPADLSLFL